MVKVTVTTDMIDGGICRDPKRCMVAHALRKAGFKEPTVTAYGFKYTTPGIFPFCTKRHYWAKLPREVSERINTFDAKLPVDPFSFELDVDPNG